MEYTTREVSARTGLPIITIQRYIKQFPEGFSDRAKIPARGRRYTGEDIRILIFIRQQLRARTPRAEIHDELTRRRATIAHLTPLYDIDSMMTFTHQVDLRLQDLNHFAHQLRRTRKVYIDHTIALFDFVKKQNEVIAEQAKRIQELELQLGRRRKRTDPPKVSKLKQIIYDIEDFLMPWETIPKPIEEEPDPDAWQIVPVDPG